jgi:hypothetical protein
MNTALRKKENYLANLLHRRDDPFTPDEVNGLSKLWESMGVPANWSELIKLYRADQSLIDPIFPGIGAKIIKLKIENDTRDCKDGYATYLYQELRKGIDTPLDPYTKYTIKTKDGDNTFTDITLFYEFIQTMIVEQNIPTEKLYRGKIINLHQNISEGVNELKRAVQNFNNVIIYNEDTVELLKQALADKSISITAGNIDIHNDLDGAHKQIRLAMNKITPEFKSTGKPIKIVLS